MPATESTRFSWFKLVEPQCSNKSSSLLISCKELLCRVQNVSLDLFMHCIYVEKELCFVWEQLARMDLISVHAINRDITNNECSNSLLYRVIAVKVLLPDVVVKFHPRLDSCTIPKTEHVFEQGDGWRHLWFMRHRKSSFFHIGSNHYHLAFTVKNWS